MGYDCTFHVIDMAAVRKFDRWFAGLGKIEKAFAERFDGESWRASLLELLKQGEDVDRELMRGLLRWCSTKAPHKLGNFSEAKEVYLVVIHRPGLSMSMASCGRR